MQHYPAIARMHVYKERDQQIELIFIIIITPCHSQLRLQQTLFDSQIVSMSHPQLNLIGWKHVPCICTSNIFIFRFIVYYRLLYLLLLLFIYALILSMINAACLGRQVKGMVICQKATSLWIF